MLEKVTPQQRFSVWPLHLTLVPWFELNGKNLPKFYFSLVSLAASTPSPHLSTGKTDYFTPHKVKVTLIKPTDQLYDLHHKLLDIIRDCEARIINGCYAGANFRPHVTHRGERGPARSEVVCRNLYIVTKTESGERQVVQILSFARS